MNTDPVTTGELFNLLTKATRDAVWDWNIETNTIWRNEGYTTLIGNDDQEQGKNVLEAWSGRIHPDDRKRVLAGICQVIDQGGTNWSDEYRLRRADDTYATVYDRGYILHREGKPVRMVGSIQDISERVLMQQARQESEDRLRFALESAQLGTWDVDPIRGTVSWDDRCKRIFGLTNHNTIAYGDTLQYIHPEDRQRVQDTVQRALTAQSGGSYQSTYRMMGDDGKLRWVRSMGQTYFTETGQAYRFSGVAQDITEEVLAREKKDLSEQQARLAIEGSGSGSFVIDLPTDTIIYSPAFAQILTGEAIIGLTRDVFINNVHPEDRLIREQAYEAGTRSGTISYEVRFIWKDGSIHWVKVLGQYIFDALGNAVSFSGIALDVTEQKEKDKALKEAEERFSIAFANTSVGMAFADQQANFTVVNDAYTELLGYSKEELHTLNSIELTHPDDRQKNRKLFDEVAQGKRPFFNLVKRYVRKDHTFRWVQMNVTRLVDAQDKSRSMVIIAYDITESVEAEAKVRASEERFRNMVTQAPVAIGILNGRNMIIEMANTFMMDLWDRNGSITGLPFIEAISELEGQGFVELLENVYDSGVAYYGSETLAQLYRKGQLEDAYFNFVYAPVRDDAGNVTGVMMVATEVTAQVMAKRALQESEQRFRELILEAPVAMALYVGQDLIIDMPNEAMLKVWGKDSSVIGQPLALALPELEGQPFLQLLDEVYTSGVAYHTQEAKVNLVVNGVLGSYYFNFTYKPLMNAEGAVYAILNMAVDVTEQVLVRKEIEELVASQETQIQARTQQLLASNHDLRRSNENLEKFAYIASHDLQEPLRKIQSFGDILKTQYTDQLGKGVDYLERIQTAASRMSMLIKDLLTFSRISTRQEATAPVQLNRMVAEVLDDLEVTIKQTDAQIQVDTLPTVSGDESQLRQLFQNLLSNALKFQQTDVTPVVQIRTGKISFSELPDSIKPTRLAPVYHCIRVSDNGIGFDAKYLDRIFQVFQRLHSRNEYAGTGIGLAICEKVVANHGGAITAISEPGHGATFVIYLPAE